LVDGSSSGFAKNPHLPLGLIFRTLKIRKKKNVIKTTFWAFFVKDKSYFLEPINN
jgi:hypothetical protein